VTPAHRAGCSPVSSGPVGSSPGGTGYRRPMDAISFGKAGLQGWRAKLADAVAEPVARRSGFDDDQVRAAVGAVFFVLSVVYVVGTVKRLASRS
jgi:hypothetical protein